MDKDAMLQLLTGLAEGIAHTFGNNCETLIQDLGEYGHPILAIFNGHVTGRGVGSTEDVFGSFKKEIDSKLLQQNWVNMMVVRGRQKIKSSTMIVRGDDYCLGLGINLDITQSAAYAEYLADQLSIDNYLETAFDSARELRLEEIFDTCVQEMGIPLDEMQKKDRIMLVHLLQKQHAFDYQKSVPYISEKLGVSRYTIYNYLKCEDPLSGIGGI